MHWFGLNWFDILINVVALAIIPGLLAAYGGHVAAEAINDSSGSRKVKLVFWLLFFSFVAMTFWQQVRISEADLAKETTQTWGEALAWRVLFAPPSPPPSSIPATRPAPKADLHAVIVNPTSPSLIIYSSDAVARDVIGVPLLWDLDQENKNTESLSVNQTAKYDWIRQDQSAGPTGLLHPHDLPNVVKQGHRIFGVVTIACPHCQRNRSYFVYFIYGQGGWYAEFPRQFEPSLKSIADSIPKMREEGPEKALSFIPQSARISIAELR